MRLPHRSAFFAACVSLVFSAALVAADTSPWPALTRENKPWARWWWLGSAVDKPNLTRELEAFAAAGFGGVEITPIYGAKGYEDRFIPYLSPKYLEMLAHVGAEAKRLGLGVDMATGTGWPFGGPQIAPADAELKLAFDTTGHLAPRPTNFKVKRSAPGGEGLVVNPYSTAALAHYLAPFTAALAQLPPGTLNSQFHDSFEYQATWANEVPAKFRTLHGYDVGDHAAELNGQGDPETVARVKADYRTTLGALHLDYINAWVAWAHAQGQTARNQAHGSPGNLLDLYAAADIPETEIFGSIPFPTPGFRRDPAEIDRPGHPPIIHKFASSAAHVTGKPYASSETFTWLREHFHESPSEMKPELDALFLAGINHIFYHGTAYSPADAPWPGWLFYASTQFNSRNPLWRDLGDGLNAYIARCQSLLQSGQSDNDLLVYWPVHDLWHDPAGAAKQLTVHASWLESSECGKLMSALTAKGYGYDLISDAQLAQTTALNNGDLKTSGATYRSILVPRTAHLPLETLQQLLALADAGATVLFIDTLPTDVEGLGDLAARRDKFKTALTALTFAKASAGDFQIAKQGRGRVIVGSLDPSLTQSGSRPEPAAALGLRIVRRRLETGYVYFIANQTGLPFDGWVNLSHVTTHAVLLDPRTGQTGAAAVMGKPTLASVYLQLAPGESLFVRTSQKNPAPHLSVWPYRKAAPAPVALSAPWNLTFLHGGPDLPPPQSLLALRSWTDATDPAAQTFAGTARYETEFTLPPDAKAADWLLDLGDVRETARVFVNGKEVDLLWSLPFRTRIGAVLKPGKNTLAVEVTNLAANRIRDLDRRKIEWKKFHEINFVNIAYKPFDASGWPLQPSGLLGPVTLTPLKAFAP